MAGEADKIEYDADLVSHDDGRVEVVLLDDKGKAPPDDGDDEEHLQGRSENDDDDEAGEGEGTGGGRKRTSARERRARQRKARDESDQRFAQLGEAFTQQNKLIQALVGNAREQAVSTLKNQMTEGQRAYNDAQARHAAAVTDADGVAATKAAADMQSATVYFHTAKQALDRATAAPQNNAGGGEGEGTRQQAPKPVPPRQRELTENFLSKRPWIDPTGDDATASAVRAIDGGVLKDGFRPDTQDYWDELDRRLKKEMPHRYQKGTQRAGPPTGGNDRGGGSQGTRRVTLTAEMQKGLEDAGLMGSDEKTVQRRQKVIREMLAKKKELESANG